MPATALPRIGSLQYNGAPVRQTRSRDADRMGGYGWRRPDPEPNWHPDTQHWYRKQAKRGIGVAYLNGAVLDELLLQDDVRAALGPASNRP